MAGDDGPDGENACGGGRYGGGLRLGESPKSDIETMLTGLMQALVSIADSSDGASL